MNEIIKKKWLEALRSGEYEQGRQRLKRDGKHCCLGVLCEVAKQSPEFSRTEWEKSDLGYLSFDGETATLSNSVRNWAGLKENNPTVSFAGHSLAYLNDSTGYSFNQIADLIEKDL